MSAGGIGALRHRITIEEPIASAAEGGAETATWAVREVLFAAVTPRSGRELFTTDSLQSRVTHTVRFRHRAGIRPDMRLRFGARILEILSVINEDERGRWTVCACEEKGP